jgi:hypothetical protein
MNSLPSTLPNYSSEANSFFSLLSSVIIAFLRSVIEAAS